VVETAAKQKDREANDGDSPFPQSCHGTPLEVPNTAQTVLKSLYPNHATAFAYSRRQPQSPRRLHSSLPRPPRGPGWAHELKHDGYRLQIHIRDGRVRLYTMNGNDSSKRYPLIIEKARKLLLRHSMFQ
jgi:ATP-dependent DNA ligase